MKFIHCSDIHLDSPMEANLSSTKARQRNAEICRTFERMVEFAKDHEVTAILISGDLFDGHRARTSTIQYILHVITAAAEIDFLYLRGNHDQKNLALCGTIPPNLKLFSDTWSYVRYGNVVIAGSEITADNCMALHNTLHLASTDTNIVMLHGQTASAPGYDTLALPLFAQKHIDYLALGHLHSYQTSSLDHRGTYCYSGCLEGRGFDECGEKGFVLLDVGAYGVHHRFIPFAGRTLHACNTDITACETVTDILTAIQTATQHIPSKDLVKVTLTGSYTPDTNKDIAFLTKVLSSAFYSITICDESRLYTEPMRYKHDLSLKSEFINSVMQDSTLSPTDLESVLQLGLSALYGKELDI